MKGMTSLNRLRIGAAMLLLVGFAAGSLLRPAPASAAFIDLGDLLGKGIKIAGVNLLVDQFGGELNKVINGLLDNNNGGHGSASKVVTIISPIGNKHIGAAQVIGPKSAVDKVGAVVQMETSFMDKTFRIKALIPIEGKDPTKINRVEGVGVSAVIDVKI